MTPLRIPRLLSALVSSALLLAAAIPAAAQLVVTGNLLDNSVVIHTWSATGNVSPVRIISGAATGLNQPAGVSVDVIHNELFVGNIGNDSITVYPLSATGNVAPLRTLAGPNTGLQQIEAIAVDATNNELIVANNFDPGTVTVYSRTASGNAAPIRTLSGNATGLMFPLGVAVDVVHDELFIANNNGSTAVSTITVYSRTANGNKAPLRTLGGANTLIENPDGIVVDLAHDELIVPDCNSFVSVFPRTAKGNVAPLRVIKGANTGLNCAIGAGLDFLHGELQVASYFDNSVKAFSRTADGNVAPLRTVTGAATGLAGTGYLAIAFPPNRGTVGLDGTMSVATAGVDFLPAGTGAGSLTVDAGTGSFAGLAGTAATAKDLAFASLQLPAKAALVDFLTFAGNPDLHFTLTRVDPGSYSSAACAAPPAAGQTCTPSGSPYNFVNTALNASQLSFSLGGTVANPYTGETSPFSATVNASFNSDYQAVLTAMGAGPVTTALTMNVVVKYSPTLDVDASSPGTTYDALTDGLLVIRYLFGLTGGTLSNGAVAATATRVEPGSVVDFLDGIRASLDVDGSGNADALTDGLLILRYLFGLRGNALIAGALDPLATRTTSTAVEAYIQTLLP